MIDKNINIHEFNQYDSETKEKIRESLFDNFYGENELKILNEIDKSDGYMSDWADNKVVIDISSNQYKPNLTTYDLNEINIQCGGPLSIFEGLVPLMNFNHLVVVVKAFLNILEKTFSTSSKKKSEVTQNFNNLIRFFSWMISKKGVYHLSSLSRADFDEFGVDMKESGGWVTQSSVGVYLDRIIEELKAGTLDIETVCSSQDYSGNKKVIVRENFIESYCGIPIASAYLPSKFYRELEEFHGGKFKSEKKDNSDFTKMMVYPYFKALNRLVEIPDGLDKPAFLPYPNANKLAKSLGDKTDRGGQKKQTMEGRTVNIGLKDAISLFSESLSWVYDYEKGVLDILKLHRAALEEKITNSPDKSSGHICAQVAADTSLEEKVNALCLEHKLPFNSVVRDKRAASFDAMSNPSLECLTKQLMTSCFIIIATNHGRRLNEIVGSNQLKYGLYFGCCLESEALPGHMLIDIYVEKTMQTYSSFYANVLVKKAVEVLEELSQIFRPLFSDLKIYETDKNKARKDKLFVWRQLTPAGFSKEPSSYNFGEASIQFFRSAGVENLALDHRAHPFRRMFALLYFYRYDNPTLMALSFHLRHLDPSTTSVYITDPAMRKEKDKIDALYNRRAKEENSQAQQDIDDVQSEMFNDTVLGILKGERCGGSWPQVVLQVYQNMSENADFENTELQQQAELVSSSLKKEAYKR